MVIIKVRLYLYLLFVVFIAEGLTERAIYIFSNKNRLLIESFYLVQLKTIK